MATPTSSSSSSRRRRNTRHVLVFTLDSFFTTTRPWVSFLFSHAAKKKSQSSASPSPSLHVGIADRKPRDVERIQWRLSSVLIVILFFLMFYHTKTLLKRMCRRRRRRRPVVVLSSLRVRECHQLVVRFTYLDDGVESPSTAVHSLPPRSLHLTADDDNETIRHDTSQRNRVKRLKRRKRRKLKRNRYHRRRYQIIPLRSTLSSAQFVSYH